MVVVHGVELGGGYGAVVVAYRWCIGLNVVFVVDR